VTVRLAIIGSRTFAPLEAVRSYVDSLPLDTIVVTGAWPSNAGGYHVVEATAGVDREAYRAAEKHGLVTVLVSGSKSKRGDLAGVQRNPTIIDLSDAVVAFWDLRSHGTAYGLHHALATNKGVLVIGPQGPVPHWRQLLPAKG
jgi:hypothetical protein